MFGIGQFVSNILEIAKPWVSKYTDEINLLTKSDEKIGITVNSSTKNIDEAVQSFESANKNSLASIKMTVCAEPVSANQNIKSSSENQQNNNDLSRLLSLKTDSLDHILQNIIADLKMLDSKTLDES